MMPGLVADVLLLVIALVTFCFAVVLLRGAPFLPTLGPQIETALDLLNLKPDQTILELGCGDGRVLIAAARRGWKAVGYELNPIMAAIAWLRTRRYGSQIRVVWGDYWSADWPAANAIFTFLLPRYMRKLDKKIAQYPHRPIVLASFAFAIPNREPAVQKDGILLYEYKK